MPIYSYVRGSLPVAVLLLYYSDTPDTTLHPNNDTRLPSRKTFLDFVSPQGKGGLAEYYRDVSRGAIDLTGSEVFGWWKMNLSYEKDSGVHGREVFMDEAERVAKEHGVDLNYYRGGILMFTNGNATGGGASNARKVVPFHIGGPWWADQDVWRVCLRCNIVTHTGTIGHPSALCSATGGGTHQYDILWPGNIYQRDFIMYSGRSSKVFRRCSKCAALVDEELRGPCANGDQHTWSSGDSSLQVPEFPQRKGVSFDTFRLCVKCHCIVYGGTHSTEKRDENGNVLLDTNGKSIMEEIGSNHFFDIELNYSLSLRYWNEFHLALIAHEFGHMLGMAESWRAKLPTNKDFSSDEIYEDRYDLMSAMRTLNFNESDGSRFKISPPILSAATLLKFGWLRQSNYRTYNFGLGTPTLSIGEISREQIYPLSTQEPVKRPLNQDDTHYGSDGIQALVIVSPNHTYTIEYRTKVGWDRAIPNNTILIHEARSNAMTGERGWTRCTKCATLWQASSSACANGNIHDYSADQNYLVIREETAVDGTQNGWASCTQCLTLYHTGQRGFCPGTIDGLGGHIKLRSFKVLINNPSAAANNEWLWCRKCQSLFLGGETYGRRAGVCSTGGTHDSTGSAKYTLGYDTVDNRTGGREFGWQMCKKCNCLSYASSNNCLAGGSHARDPLDPWNDFSMTVHRQGIKPALYEYGWKRCITCAQLVYEGGGRTGPCTVRIGLLVPFIPHKFEPGALEYGVTTEAHGDPVNAPYSNLGRKCAKCLAMVVVDWNGNIDTDCAGGGKHDIQASSHYNIVSFDRDFTYLVGRDPDPAQGNRTYEFFPGDTFEDPKVGLKITIGSVSASTGKIDVAIQRTA